MCIISIFHHTNVLLQVLVSVSDLSLESQVPLGVVLSLFSALFYAAYLVFLRRKVDNEDKMDIPLFFGNTQINLQESQYV